MNNIQYKVKFWSELWDDLIENFLKRSYGLTLYNPHILIDDIISEIENNSFKNPENKKFFYSKLTDYINHDVVIKENLKSQFKILRQVFNTDRINYTLEISKEIRNLFLQGFYFDSSLDAIRKLINSDEEVTTDFMNALSYHTQGVIVELIKKSYEINDIKKFVSNIFASYSFIKENFLLTDYPHDIDTDNYKYADGSFNRDEYNKDVITHISSLSLNERILKLSYYFYKIKERAHYIFVIEGLKGEVDLNIGDVCFYSLSKKQFAKENLQIIASEEIQRHQRPEKYIQAAVEVDYLLPKSSLTQALNKLENALDLLSCYFTHKTDITIDSSHYVIVKDEQLIYSSMGPNNRDSKMKYYDSLNLDSIKETVEKLNKYAFLWNGNSQNNQSILKINNALHWYRKAEQSLRNEDKILSYWIALENLFSVEKDIKKDILNDSNKSIFHLIQEIISSVDVFVFKYNYGWELYHHYSSSAEYPEFSKSNIPEELINKAQLRPKSLEKIYLKNFIDILNELRQYEDNIFFLDKINALLEFYSDSSKAKIKINEHIQQVKNDILMIYRLRNLIVHNAHFDNTLLPHFVWKIKGYASTLIRELISNYSTDSDLAEMLIRIHLKKEKFLQDLESGNIDLLKNEIK